MPVRICRRAPQLRSSSSFSSARDPRSSTAARAARRASSSWTSGTPNTAMTASPMNFSTVPPCRSSTLRATSKYLDITLRSDSESRRSPRDVESVTSENSTVTVLRISLPSATSEAPQNPQNWNPSGFSLPHFWHASTDRSLWGRRARFPGRAQGVRGPISRPAMARRRIAGERSLIQPRTEPGPPRSSLTRLGPSAERRPTAHGQGRCGSYTVPFASATSGRVPWSSWGHDGGTMNSRR